MGIKKKCGEITCSRYDTDSVLCTYCELNDNSIWAMLEKNNDK